MIRFCDLSTASAELTAANSWVGVVSISSAPTTLRARGLEIGRYPIDVHRITCEDDRVGMSRASMRDLLDWHREFVARNGLDAPVLVHCFAGISRSSAVASILMTERGEEVEDIAALRLGAMPRERVVPNAAIMRAYARIRREP